MVNQALNGNFEKCNTLKYIETFYMITKCSNYTTGQKRLILGREKYEPLLHPLFIIEQVTFV